MEIAFVTKELRDLCHEESTVAEHFGPSVAGALKNRISDIVAADCIGDVLAGSPRQSEWEGSECYVLDLGEGIDLRMIPNHREHRSGKGGQVDWTKVRRVKVVYLGKRYD